MKNQFRKFCGKFLVLGCALIFLTILSGCAGMEESTDFSPQEPPRKKEKKFDPENFDIPEYEPKEIQR